MNNVVLFQYIRDLFFEKVANRANLEFIEVDIRLTLCNLGTDNQVRTWLLLFHRFIFYAQAYGFEM